MLLALPAPGWSQPALPTGRSLKINVVRGEGVVNSITGNAAPVIVEVRDENEKPVARAEVVFQLPFTGPGGTFYGWLRTNTTRTDEQGRATSAPFTPNSEEGPFEIVVTASDAGRRATVRVAQSNSRSGTPVVKKSHKAIWVVLGVVAAGAIGGGIAASRGGSSSTAVVSTPVTISPGVVTVGGPR